MSTMSTLAAAFRGLLGGAAAVVAVVCAVGVGMWISDTLTVDDPAGFPWVKRAAQHTGDTLWVRLSDREPGIPSRGTAALMSMDPGSSVGSLTIKNSGSTSLMDARVRGHVDVRAVRDVDARRLRAASAEFQGVRLLDLRGAEIPSVTVDASSVRIVLYSGTSRLGGAELG